MLLTMPQNSHFAQHTSDLWKSRRVSICKTQIIGGNEVQYNVLYSVSSAHALLQQVPFSPKIISSLLAGPAAPKQLIRRASLSDRSIRRSSSDHPLYSILRQTTFDHEETLVETRDLPTPLELPAATLPTLLDSRTQDATKPSSSGSSPITSVFSSVMSGARDYQLQRSQSSPPQTAAAPEPKPAPSVPELNPTNKEKIISILSSLPKRVRAILKDALVSFACTPTTAIRHLQRYAQQKSATVRKVNDVVCKCLRKVYQIRCRGDNCMRFTIAMASYIYIFVQISQYCCDTSAPPPAKVQQQLEFAIDAFKLNFNSLTMYMQIYVLIPHPALDTVSFADFFTMVQRPNTRVDAILRRLSRKQPYSDALCDIEELNDAHIVTLLESMYSNLQIFSIFAAQPEERVEPEPVPEGILRHIILPKKSVSRPKVVKQADPCPKPAEKCVNPLLTPRPHIYNGVEKVMKLRGILKPSPPSSTVTTSKKRKSEGMMQVVPDTPEKKRKSF